MLIPQYWSSLPIRSSNRPELSHVVGMKHGYHNNSNIKITEKSSILGQSIVWYQVNTCTTTAQRPRRRTNIVQMLYRYFMFAGVVLSSQALPFLQTQDLIGRVRIVLLGSPIRRQGSSGSRGEFRGLWPCWSALKRTWYREKPLGSRISKWKIIMMDSVVMVDVPLAQCIASCGICWPCIDKSTSIKLVIPYTS